MLLSFSPSLPPPLSLSLSRSLPPSSILKNKFIFVLGTWESSLFTSELGSMSKKYVVIDLFSLLFPIVFFSSFYFILCYLEFVSSISLLETFPCVFTLIKSKGKYCVDFRALSTHPSCFKCHSCPVLSHLNPYISCCCYFIQCSYLSSCWPFYLFSIFFLHPNSLLLLLYFSLSLKMHFFTAGFGDKYSQVLFICKCR